MKQKKALKKGLHLYEGKELSKDYPLTKINASQIMVYPLSQHLGKPASEAVKVGDRVLKGQLIARADGFISAPIYSAVSGTVKAIKNNPVINGSSPKSIIIENDGLDEAVEGFGVKRNPDDFSNQEIIDIIRDAGIVGLGGAGFPTYVKLTPKSPENIDTIIINGCECEPYLTIDHRVMLEKSKEILSAVRQVLRLFPGAKAIFGIEDNKPEAIHSVKGNIKPDDRIDVMALKTKYPQGGERSLIHSVTGRRINSKMLPADAKCIVLNASTCYAIYNALFLNIPLINRFMTISGDGVNTCANLEVPIGIDLQSVADFCGGIKDGIQKLISGGPMTGFALSSLDVPVQKTTASILAFMKDDIEGLEQSNCIHCGRCASVCPSNLVPQMMGKAVKMNDIDRFEALGGMECVQCGCCAYTCPAKIPLTHMFNLGKAEVRKKSQKK